MEDGRIPRSKIIDRRSSLKCFTINTYSLVVIENFLLNDNDICFHVEDQIKMKETKKKVIHNFRRWKKKRKNR